MFMPQPQQSYIVANGVTGFLASFAGLGVTYIDTIELWLRMVSLVIGILVGLITLINLLRKPRKK